MSFKWKVKSHAGLVTGWTNANVVKKRERSDTAPKIHYGTIGSADPSDEGCYSQRPVGVKGQWFML
jgi:hypothetical protein